MAKNHSITASISTQPAGARRRSQSALDWNTPKKTGTPRREYAFMRHYGMVWMRPSTGGFGPGNSEVHQ
jgi:hypothetical protein